MHRRAFLIAAFVGPGLSGSARAQAESADAEVIEAIEKVGGSVRQTAQNDDRLEVDFHLAGSSVTNESMEAVGKLANVVHLHLGNTGVDDAVLAHLKELTSLTRLHLEKTAVTDAGLRHLKKLTNLEYLNLYGTNVSDDGLRELHALKSLKNLYLWQTKVTENGVKAIQSALPDLKVDTGWQLAEPKAEDAPAESEKPEP